MATTISSKAELTDLIKARYPLVYCVTPEEKRVELALLSLCQTRRYVLSFWSFISGFRTLSGSLKGDEKINDPVKALDYVLSSEVGDGGVFVLCDFHPFLKDARTIRKMRETIAALPGKGKSIIILSPVMEIPRELDKEIAVVDWDLPGREEIGDILRNTITNLPPGCNAGIASDASGFDTVVDSLIGLTAIEIDNVLAKSIVRHRSPDVRTILGEKKAIIRKSGMLEYYEATQDLASVGGYESLKGWLRKRKHAFTPQARAYGLPVPRGLLLLGVPGCGKSLTAKAVSAAWNMPCLKLDVGKLFGSLVGDSEKNVRNALKTAEAVAPCVLWLDELDKAFAGVSGQSGDSGTSQRVFGTFITWMQEKTAPVFVIATANDVSGLPPELLRKGRFDEIFYTDLPSPAEREEILKIHLASKGRDASAVEMSQVMTAMQDFTGSEVEQAVIAALYEAYDANPADRTLSTDALVSAAREIVPLAHTMRERIDGMRNWARSRARSASAAPIPEASGAAPAESADKPAHKGKGRKLAVD